MVLLIVVLLLASNVYGQDPCSFEDGKLKNTGPTCDCGSFTGEEQVICNKDTNGLYCWKQYKRCSPRPTGLFVEVTAKVACSYETGRHMIKNLDDCYRGNNEVGVYQGKIEVGEDLTSDAETATITKAPGCTRADRGLLLNYDKNFNTGSVCGDGGYDCICWIGSQCEEQVGLLTNPYACKCGIKICDENTGMLCGLKEWVIGLSVPQIVEENEGAVVTQGSVTGTLKTKPENEWILTLSSNVKFDADAGVSVTQGSVTGILKTALEKSVTRTVVIIVSNFDVDKTFVSTSDVVIDVDTIVQTDIDTAVNGITSLEIQSEPGVIFSKSAEWTIGINPQAITEIAGVVASQNEWTMNIIGTLINEAAGVLVTQGDNTGTLKEAVQGIAVSQSGNTPSCSTTCDPNAANSICNPNAAFGYIGAATSSAGLVVEIDEIPAGSEITLVVLLTNAVTDENELSFASAHGLAAGTEVVYFDNSVATIPGLADGATYYVLDGTSNSNMKLETSLGGGAITIAAGGGANGNKISRNDIRVGMLVSAKAANGDHRIPPGTTVDSFDLATGKVGLSVALSEATPGPNIPLTFQCVNGLVLGEIQTIFGDASFAPTVGQTMISASLPASTIVVAVDGMKITLSQPVVTAVTGEQRIVFESTTTFVISAKADIIFLKGVEIKIGSITVLNDRVDKAQQTQNNKGFLAVALQNEWNVAIAPQNIEELPGVDVKQAGVLKGRLKTELDGIVELIWIQTAADVTFISGVEIEIGSTTVSNGNVIAVQNSGITSSMVIETAADVTFINTADIVIGTTTVGFDNVKTAIFALNDFNIRSTTGNTDTKVEMINVNMVNGLGQCSNPPECESKIGYIKASRECTCSIGQFCKTGTYCSAKDTTCLDIGNCQYKYGARHNNEKCLCTDDVANTLCDADTGQYCNLDGTCTKTAVELCDPGQYSLRYTIEYNVNYPDITTNCISMTNQTCEKGSGYSSASAVLETFGWPIGKSNWKSSLADDGICEMCPLGYFKNQHGPLSCLPCDAGTFIDVSNSTFCKDCPVGYYQELEGKSVCDACESGKYLNEIKKSSETFCLKCNRGQYSTEDGSNQCTLCEAGKNLMKTGQNTKTACADCPSKTYVETPGHDRNCYPCDSAVEGKKGNILCPGCSPGQRMIGPVDNNGQATNSDCENCPKGRFSDDRDRPECLECPKGFHAKVDDESGTSLWLSECQTCAQGRYGNKEGLTNGELCVRCAPGRYSEKVAVIAEDRPDDIEYANTICEPCIKGKYSQNEWTVTMVPQPITESAGVIVRQGEYGAITGTLKTSLQNEWTFGIESQDITESAGVDVKQVDAQQRTTTGTLKLELKSEWELDFTGQGITEKAGVTVSQGSNTGVLQISHQNEWTMDFESQAITENADAMVSQNEWLLKIEEQNINERAGVLVTQNEWTFSIVEQPIPKVRADSVVTQIISGVSVTGTLKTELDGDTTNVVITTDPGDTFVSSADLLFGGAEWTLEITPQKIKGRDGNPGATVTQGSATGTLKKLVKDRSTQETTTLVITTAAGVTFVDGVEVMVGETLIEGKTTEGTNPIISPTAIESKPSIAIEHATIITAMHSVSAVGTLKTTLNGPTFEVEIQTAPGITFKKETKLMIGNTEVASINTNEATNTLSAIGTLKTELQNEWTFSISQAVTENPGVIVSQNEWTINFVSQTLDAIKAGMTVTQGDSTGLLKHAIDGSTDHLVITAAIGVTFLSTVGLKIDGDPLVEGATIQTAINSLSVTGKLVTDLRTPLQSEWTINIAPQAITENAGVSVTQNEWIVEIQTQTVEVIAAGVTVTQGSDSGILKTRLEGAIQSFMITAPVGVTFLSTADMLIGNVLVEGANIRVTTNNLFVVGTLKTALQNEWTMGIESQALVENAGVVVSQNEWTIRIESEIITESIGVTVSQNEWTLAIDAQDITKNAGVIVSQNEWTLAVSSTCIPASTNGACSNTAAPTNQAACDPQSLGSCAGGGGAECTNVVNGPEATCVATMDDTAGGATPCVWTSTNLCTYSALIITENAGVTVRQNTASGTLKTALTGEGMTSVVIQAAVGVTFVNGLEVTIGESTVTFDKVSSATNDFSNIGTLKTTLTGADMTSIVITAAAGVSFVTGADVVIGTGSTATTITYATLNTVTNSQSALGTLVAELNGDTTSLNIFTGSTSATFVTSADLVVGSTTVVFANVKTATQTTGILKTALTGDTTSVVIQTASGIIFFDNRDLLITTASGFETVAHTNVNSAINNGATTNVVIQTVSGVTFKNTANLVIGDTNVHFDDITTANGDPNRNAVIQTTSGIQFVNDADLIIGNTRIDFTNIYTAINNGASTRIVILTASGSSEVDCKNCARDRRSNAVASPVAECENCFSTTTDLTIGNTKVGFSNITTATNNGATTRTVVETASGVSFVTQSEAEGDNLMIGNTEVAIKEITKAINKGATTTVIIETASGIIFDKDTEIMIGSTLVEVANLNSVENTGATDSVIIQTAFSASSPVQFFTTVNLAFIGPNGRYTVYADKILTAVNSKPNTGLTQETQCTQCSTGLYSITLASDAATDCKVCVAGKFNENMGAGDVSLCLSCPAGYSQDTPGQSFCLPCTPGRHQDVSSEIDCKDCARGRRSNAVASPVAECEKCSIGQFQPSVKSTFCANCRPGSYQNVIGQEECFDCWKGRFASDEGRHNCTNCDVGKTAIANGSTVCNDCDPGTYGKGTSCWACPSGYKRHEDDPTTSCLHCPQGTDTENRPNAVQCTPCTFGWYGFSKGVCARCQEGTFQDTSGESTCKACENGVANKAKSACDKCTQGKRGRNITEILSQKLFSKRAGEDDEDANKRETELNEKRYCVQCERGQFNDLLGQSNCQYCANSRKDQPNIKQTACELKPYKQADDCNEDEYLNASYYTDEPPYFGKEKWKCMLCPLGGDCKNASTTLATIRSSNGWWRIPNDYTPTCQTTLPAECNRTETDEKGVEKCIEYIPVPSDDACIQWTLFANCNPIQNCIPAGAGPNETQCREGTDPSVDLCSKCLPGYNRQGPYCVQCTAGDTAIRGSMMLIVLGLLGVLAAKNKERLEKLGKKYQQAFKDGMLAFKIIMSFMQVQQSMGSSLGGQFQFPEIYVDFLANFDIVNMDPINMMGASCVGKVDFRMTLTIGLGFVSSIVVIGAIVYIFGKHSIHNKAHDLSDENKRLFMGKLFDLSDFDESGEIESFELFLLFDFVADREFEKGVLQDQVDILKEDQDRLLVIMINAGAHESENEFGKYKLLRHKFIEATFKKHDARKDQFKELSHFVPIVQAIEQVKEQELLANVMSSIIQLFLMIHTPIAMKAFQYFDCHDLGEDKRKLRADYELDCDSPEYDEYLPVAYTLLFGFALSLPLFVGWILFSHRHSLDSPSTRASIGFLYSRFHWPYWDVFNVIRKISLVGILLFIPGNIRAVSALLICMFGCCTLNFFQPQRNVVVFWISQAAFLMITVKYLVVIFAMTDLDIDQMEALGYVLMGCDIFILLGTVFSFLAIYFLMRRSIQKINAMELKEKLEADARKKELMANGEWDEKANKRRKTREQRGLSFKNRKFLKRAVTASQATDIQENSLIYKKTALKKIRIRLRESDKRLRKRLAPRRKKLAKNLKRINRKKQVHPTDQESLSANEIVLSGDGDRDQNEEDEEEKMDNQLTKDVERVRQLIKKMIKSEKRLIAIMNMLDDDKSGKLSHPEFSNLVLKVLKKSHDVNASPELLDAVWEDVRVNRKHEADEEICEDTLNFWLGFEDNAMDGDPMAAKDAAALKTYIEVEAAHDPLELQANKMILTMVKMLKNRGRLAGLFKMLGVTDLMNITKEYFIKFCEKIIKKQDEITDLTEELLAELWSLAKDHDQNNDKLSTVISDMSLCIWLGFEKAPVVSESPTTKDKQTASSSDSAATEKIRLLMRKMVKSEKRLLGIIKMIDLDASGKLSESEFGKLVQKVLKKQKEIVTGPGLMSMVWNELLNNRQDMKQNEIGSYELCTWLELEMNRPPRSTETPASANEDTALGEDTALAHTLNAEKVRLQIKLMVKDSTRLLGLIKMVGGDAKNFNQTSFVKLTQKVFKKQKEIVPSPELLASVWEIVKSKRKEPFVHPEVGINELCSYLDLEPADKPPVVAAATEKQDGGDSGSSGDLKENAEKLRTQMKKMIKDGKRLLGIIKMIDGDGSGRLNESEFNKLCKKVLKKQKEVVTSPELLAICWGDVQKLRQDKSKIEIGDFELCSYLDLEPADKPPVVAAATKKDDDGNVEKMRLSMCKAVKTGKRLFSIIKMIDGDGSGRLDESEFNKLCKKVLKKQKEIVASPELLKQTWEEVKKHRKDMAQEEIGQAELSAFLGLK